jgi:HEAT repeat protein
MQKRWLLCILVLILIGVTLALITPTPFYLSLGVVRHEAFFAGKPTNYWARALKQDRFLGHAPPQGDIGKTLRQGGAAAVPVLCEIAQSPDDKLRYEALLALSVMGPEAKAAAPTLETAIKREKESSKFLLASDTLARLDPATATPVLSAVLADKEDEGSRRSWALATLLKHAPETQAALPTLKHLVQDKDDSVQLRVQALLLLWRLKQPAAPLVSELCATASDPKGLAGVQSLEALGDMGPDAATAVPALLKLLEKPGLATVGTRWGPAHQGAVAAPAVPALLALLKSNKVQIHREVILALGGIGPSARAAVPALVAILTTREAIIWASVTLLATRPPTALAILPLVEIAQKTWLPREDPVHAAIRDALARIQPQTAQAPAQRNH